MPLLLFLKIKMKKIILFSVILAASTMGVNAQNYVLDEYSYSVTPGDFTVNGKATLVVNKSDDKESSDYNFAVLDENFKEKKTIKIPVRTGMVICERSYDDGVTWVRDTEHDYADELTELEDDFEYKNYDESKFITDDYFAFSQTLFNNDDKWEYLVYEYEETGEEYTYTRSASEETENGWVSFLVKYTYKKTKFKQTNVCSEDGTVLMSFYPSVNVNDCYDYYMYIDEIWVLNGKTYLLIDESWEIEDGEIIDRFYKETLYELDRETNSVKAVSSNESKKRIAEVQDGVIKVSIDEKDTDSNLTLTNSAGMLIDTQRMPKGKTNAEIDAHRLNKGVYNISLSRHGKVLNSQKFLVK